MPCDVASEQLIGEPKIMSKNIALNLRGQSARNANLSSDDQPATCNNLQAHQLVLCREARCANMPPIKVSRIVSFSSELSVWDVVCHSPTDQKQPHVARNILTSADCVWKGKAGSKQSIILQVAYQS